MTSRFRYGCALLVTFLLVSCGGLKLGMDGLHFDVAGTDIQKKIDKTAGFPVHKELGSYGKIQVSQAKLLLIPKDNSVGLSVPVKVSAFVKSWSGTVAVSATPVYEKETGTIYLTNFALREVQVSGLPSEATSLAAKAVTLILNETVKRYDVYTLDRSKFGEDMARLALKDIKVREDAVVFHLGL